MIKLIELHAILPNEEHSSSFAEQLAQRIRDTGRWVLPIVLERASLAVMDGHHRLAAARLLGLELVPSLLLDYSVVKVIASREGYIVTPTAIVERSLANDLYPSKTTKHIFPFPIPSCDVPLHRCEYLHGRLIFTS